MSGISHETQADVVLTTGQVAKFCKVAPRTVAKWIDQGLLKGYRIPGSQDRRVPKDNLVRFCQEHGIPMSWLNANDPCLRAPLHTLPTEAMSWVP